MDECPKRIPAQLSRHVLQSNPRSDVPDVSWIRESDATSGVSRRFLKEGFVFCITTDDPIQRDDVGGKKLTGNPYEITVDESDRVASASTRRLRGRRRDIRGRQVDTDRFRQSSLDQLKRQRTDPGSDIEQPPVWWPNLRNARQQETRRGPRPLGTVVCEIFRRSLLAKLSFRGGADARTTTAHRHLLRTADRFTPMTP
jgi:hypothetical protein